MDQVRSKLVSTLQAALIENLDTNIIDARGTEEALERAKDLVLQSDDGTRRAGIYLGDGRGAPRVWTPQYIRTDLEIDLLLFVRGTEFQTSDFNRIILDVMKLLADNDLGLVAPRCSPESGINETASHIERSENVAYKTITFKIQILDER